MISTIFKILFEAHPKITKPEERRVAEIMSVYHFLMLPIGFFSVELMRFTVPVGEEIPLWWGFLISALTMMCYIVSRSSQYRIVVYLLIFTGILGPALTLPVYPYRQSVHFAFVLPILIAALFLRFRELLATVAIVTGLYWGYAVYAGDPEITLTMFGSSVVITMIVFLVAAIRYHNSWLEEMRINRLHRQHEQTLGLMRLCFDFTIEVHENRIAEVDERLVAMFNRSVEELEGAEIQHLLPELPREHSFIGELRYLRGDGSEGMVQVATQAMSGPVQLIAIRDITSEIRQRVEQLKLERLSSAALLSAGIAHELNTPLMVALNKLERGINEPSKKLNHDVHSILLRLTTLMDDLRWFTEDDDSGPVLEPAEICEHTIRLMLHRIGHMADIHLIRCERSSVNVPPSAFAHILFNVLCYATENKQLGDNKNVNVSSFEHQGEYVIEVEFEPMKLPDVGPKQFTQRGLGISICKSYAEEHSGRVSVSSNSVRVFLPLFSGEEQGSAQIALFQNQGQDLSTIASLLEPNHVSQYSEVSTLLNALESNEFDVIFSRLTHSGMMTLRLLEKLKMYNRGFLSKLVLLSNQPPPTSIQRILERYPVHFLQTPVSRGQLNSTISKIMRRSKATVIEQV